MDTHIIDYIYRKNIITSFLLFELKVAYRECVLKRIDKKKSRVLFFFLDLRVEFQKTMYLIPEIEQVNRTFYLK
jgi:hypothetical protein